MSTPHGPQTAQRHRRRAFWAAGIAAVVLAGAAVLVAVFGVGGFPRTAGRPTAAPPESRVTGTPADWAAAVCRGRPLITDGSKFGRSGPAEVSNCAARADNPGLSPPGLMFARWPTADIGDLVKVTRAMGCDGVAVAPVDGGVFAFASSQDMTRKALEPLRQFGFAITSLR